MIFNLLEGEATTGGNNWVSYVLIIGLLVVFVGFFIWNNMSQKKKQKEAQSLIDAIKPGNKVKTIGGICGVVVEIDNDENTFVLETGTDKNKSYVKFDRQAIYQTDAKPEEKAINEVPKEEAELNETAETTEDKNDDLKDLK